MEIIDADQIRIPGVRLLAIFVIAGFNRNVKVLLLFVCLHTGDHDLRGQGGGLVTSSYVSPNLVHVEDFHSTRPGTAMIGV